MPTRILNNQEAFETCEEWLNENLNINAIVPIAENLKKVPTTKGIYFWFLHPNGYGALSSILQINPIQESFKKNIDGAYYDLVYLGTAGVRKNKNEVNYSELRVRLKWHISDNKRETNVCSGTMSTFRRTIGPLISNDLIEIDTQNKIDDIFKKYFKIFYIVYPGTFLEVKDVVNPDEGILIDKLRPVFNLDKNSNTKTSDHITSKIQIRRKLIENSTKIRLGCNKTKTPKAENEKSPKTKPVGSKTINKKSEVVISSIGKNCIEFNVLKNQNIHEIINLRNDLPKGECWMLLFNSAKPSQLVYASKRKNGWRKTGNGINQNIKKYFSNTDENRDRAVRWKIVQNEMIEKKIKEITVKVYESIIKGNNSDLSSNLISIPTKPIPKIKSEHLAIPTKKGNKKIAFLVPCSSKKYPILENYNSTKLDNLSFNKELGEYRKELVEKLETCKEHNGTRKNKKVIIKKQVIDMTKRLPAYKLYSLGRLFSKAKSNEWTLEKANKVYIISALFGIVKATDYLPMYDLAIKDQLYLGSEKKSPLKFWKKKLDSIIENLINEGYIVYDLLSDDYKKVIPKSLEKLKSTGIKWKSDRGPKRGEWLKQNIHL